MVILATPTWPANADSGAASAALFLFPFTRRDPMTLLFGFYVLVWPALTLAVLVVIMRAVLKDRADARRTNRELV